MAKKLWSCSLLVMAVICIACGAPTKSPPHNVSTLSHATDDRSVSDATVSRSKPISKTITIADYEAVKLGTSPIEVSLQLGSPGEEVSRVELGFTTTFIRQWTNGLGDGGGNCKVTFQNGKAIAKAQFGLPLGSSADSAEKLRQNRQARDDLETEMYSYLAGAGRNEVERKRLPEYRLWSDTTGDFNERARLDRFSNDPVQGRIVHLEREDGTTLDVLISRLSPGDAVWAREEIKRRAKEK